MVSESKWGRSQTDSENKSTWVAVRKINEVQKSTYSYTNIRTHAKHTSHTRTCEHVRMKVKKEPIHCLCHCHFHHQATAAAEAEAAQQPTKSCWNTENRVRDIENSHKFFGILRIRIYKYLNTTHIITRIWCARRVNEMYMHRGERASERMKRAT